MIKFKRTYKGVTFVEMIVTIVVMSIVMLGASLFFVRMWMMHHFAIKSGIASFVASKAVEDSVNMMRKAQQPLNGTFPIEVADDHEFIFYADYDNDSDVEKVRYFVEDGVFRRGVIEPDTAIPPAYGGTEEVRDLANNITNDIASGEVIFSYYSGDGTIYEYDDIEGMALETMATPADIRMVKIVLYVNPEPVFRSPDDVRIESFVVVRNLTEFDNIPT